jgi:hypothetical protein
MPRPLMCPQCGSPLLYVEDEHGNKLFFTIDRKDGKINPTKSEYNTVLEMDIEIIKCSQCSWKGGKHKLKKYFT